MTEEGYLQIKIRDLKQEFEEIKNKTENLKEEMSRNVNVVNKEIELVNKQMEKYYELFHNLNNIFDKLDERIVSEVNRLFIEKDKILDMNIKNKYKKNIKLINYFVETTNKSLKSFEDAISKNNHKINCIFSKLKIDCKLNCNNLCWEKDQNNTKR